MTSKQWRRLDAVARVAKGELSLAQGALLARMSARSFRRLRKRVALEKTKGVVHGNVGRVPWNRVSDEDRDRIVKLAKTKYVGFNDHHFTEKLVEVEKLRISRASVQRLLRDANVTSPRRRRPRKHRRRRERREREGMMLLWDGSRHDWFEGRGAVATLVGAIDDATGQLMPGAHFVEQECAAAYLRLTREVVSRKGIPISIYMDRHGSLRRNDASSTLEEELTGKRRPTQVARALEELGIETIFALSPQAKGRVERLWGTLQSRLVSELRLAKISTIADANVLLERTFIDDFNKRFAVTSRETGAIWRSIPEEADLNLICSFHYRTVVGNDNAVRIGPSIIDVPPGPRQRSYARAIVDAFQHLDGSWSILHQGGVIAKRGAEPGKGELRVASGYTKHPRKKPTINQERFWGDPA